MKNRALVQKDTLRRRVRSLSGLALAVFFAAHLTFACICSALAPPEDASGTREGSVAFDPGKPDTYSAVLYNNTNGLPTSEANVIVQTSEGFLWIGCYGGLIRYDGNTFVRMDSSSGITSVRSLYVDARDRLWIGTNDNGLFLMKDGDIRRWGEEEGLPSLSLRGLLEDDTGTVYAATSGGLALLDRDLTLRLPEDDRLKTSSIHELRPGENGCIYGLTGDGDIFSMHGGELLWFLKRGDSRFKGISCITSDPVHPGYMYVEARNGLIYHGTPDNGFSTAREVDIRPLQFVQEFRYIDGRLWICAGNGIGYLDEQGFHLMENLPMTGSVGSVTSDYEGNLWFTSTRQGVMKLVRNRFADMLQGSDLSETVVNSTCMYDGMLFLGTDTGLRVLSDSVSVKRIPLNSPQTIAGSDPDEQTDNLIELLEGVRIRSLIRDSRDRLWISTWRNLGLLRYDHGELKIFDPSNGLSSDRVRTVVERSDGSFLAACSGGVDVIEGDRVTARYGEADGIGNTDILTVCEGPKGEILVGTDGGGIYVLGDGAPRHIDKGDGLHSGVVMRIKRDRTRDIYWIITGNSLAWMDPDGKVTTLEQFPYFNNFDLYESSRDVMWVLSGNGVYVANVDSVLEDTEYQSIYFNISNGLPCIPTSNAYSELTEEGILYIAGASGVARVDIEAPMDKVSDLRMAVPFIDADGVRLYPDENGGFVVKPYVRKLTIYAYVYNYSLIDPRVNCCLFGFDQSTFSVERRDLVPMDYTNLPGGTYFFTMQLSDPLGLEDNHLAVEIVKERKLSERWWFYILVSGLIIGALSVAFGAYTRNRIRVLEKKHREEVEKERIASELQMANQIQSGTLPHQFPPFPERREFDLYASMDPARDVGGDFYDFFLIDDDHLCLVIADVSGKGIPAALFMMNAKAILRNCAMLGHLPGDILQRTNEAICADNQMEMFVTVWLGILEISTGRITAANAGHEYPAVMTHGRFELLKDRHGLVIGALEGAKYKEYEIRLAPGDKLFVYTDGVPEATDAEQRMLGTERMLEALNAAPEGDPAQILAGVRAAVDGFVKEAEQFDDLTMLCLEYRGPDGAAQ